MTEEGIWAIVIALSPWLLLGAGVVFYLIWNAFLGRFR